MTDLIAAHEIPNRIYQIPYKINYVAKLFDFKFANFFIKEEYPKIQDILQHTSDSTFLAKLLSKHYMHSSAKITNMLLLSAAMQNGNLFAVLCCIVYWKWIRLQFDQSTLVSANIFLFFAK